MPEKRTEGCTIYAFILRHVCIAFLSNFYTIKWLIDGAMPTFVQKMAHLSGSKGKLKSSTVEMADVKRKLDLTGLFIEKRK